MGLIRFIVGFVFFSLGCSTLVTIGSGKYFADLPPNADSAEVWGSIFAAVLALGLGFIGLKMLTSLLRRGNPESTSPTTTPMSWPRAFARKTIGFVLVVLATALFVGTLKTLPHTGAAETTGYVIGATILPLILGYVGTKMMFRGELLSAPSPSPIASPQ